MQRDDETIHLQLPAWRRTMRRPAFPAIPHFGNNFTDGSLFPGRPPPVILSSGLDCRRFPAGKTTSITYFDHLGKDPEKSLSHT
jgi:hypothetical protein